MKNLKLYALLFVALAVFSSCEDEVEAPGTSYASFESYLGDITVTPGVDFSKTISIYAANVTSSDRTINLTLTGTLDAASYVAPTSVTIPANSNVGSLELIFKDVNLDIVLDKTLSISMTETTDLYVGDDITLNVAKGCPSGESKFKIAVELDQYPEEVYWRVIDLTAGTIVLTNNTSPGYGGYANAVGTQRDATCFAPGDYLFQIFDAYQDGGGAFSFSLNGSQIYSNNGVYGAGTEFPFTVE